MKKLIFCAIVVLFAVITLNAQQTNTKKEKNTGKPVEKTQPAQPTQPTQPTQPVQPAQPTQPAQPAPQVDNPNAPEIIFEKEEHNFGLLQKGADCNTEFKFTNTGKEPLLLSNVKASCGCTTPSWPKEPIPPGGSNVIKVKYDSNRVGKFTKTVTVSSNAKSATKVIKITGEIQAPPEIKAPVKDESPMVPKTNQ